jgi:hypothetical protein
VCSVDVVVPQVEMQSGGTNERHRAGLDQYQGDGGSVSAVKPPGSADPEWWHATKYGFDAQSDLPICCGPIRVAAVIWCEVRVAAAGADGGGGAGGPVSLGSRPCSTSQQLAIGGAGHLCQVGDRDGNGSSHIDQPTLLATGDPKDR